MKLKTKKVLEVVLTSAIAVLLAFLVYIILDKYIIKNPEVYLPAPITYEKSLSTAEGALIPEHLVIPSLGINASVEHVGRDYKGRMAVPILFENVGWFREGFVPGEKGNAVVAGHLDDGKGDPAVFVDLEKLEEGDRIILEGAGGLLEYRVVGRKYYDYNATDTSDIFGPADISRLNLITCDGSWIAGERTYDTRLVVSAELI